MRRLCQTICLSAASSASTATRSPSVASGARITAHLLYELKRRGVRYGLGSACIGGGQGIALVIESV